jgi:transposase
MPGRFALESADGVGTNEIMRVTGTSKTCVWRWQQRFMEAGTDGLLVDKTRPSRIPALDATVVERAVALTLTEPPGETTHWTAAAVAAACSISISSVHRIWRSHGLRPHQIRQFKLSNDPQFAAKVRDIVGLYVNPPEHAVVLSVDEKSQIQALDRTQPGLPLKKGRCGTMTRPSHTWGVPSTGVDLPSALRGRIGAGRAGVRRLHGQYEAKNGRNPPLFADPGAISAVAALSEIISLSWARSKATPHAEIVREPLPV